jgi:hypothetical protein
MSRLAMECDAIFAVQAAKESSWDQWSEEHTIMDVELDNGCKPEDADIRYTDLMEFVEAEKKDADAEIKRRMVLGREQN